MSKELWKGVASKMPPTSKSKDAKGISHGTKTAASSTVSWKGVKPMPTGATKEEAKSWPKESSSKMVEARGDKVKVTSGNG